MASSTSTPTPEGRAAPSTSPAGLVQIGDVVLVRVDLQQFRPLLIAEVHPDGSVSGAIICNADDHTRPAFRGWESGDGARIHGRPDRLLPLAFGELLHEGPALGQWRRR